MWLQHLQDARLVGSLTIDKGWRMATRLDTPVEYLHYRDIEPR